MRTLGVDLASADANTAACVLDWSAGVPRVDQLEPGAVGDQLIVDLGRDADVIAIDAPFGWPVAFAALVAAYAAGSPWPDERPDPAALWFRETDRAAMRTAGGRPPLSVSSDRIARPAERAARLLTLMGRDGRARSRDGSDGVIEVYPAGALRVWGIAAVGYKAPDAAGASARAQILDALTARTGLITSGSHRVIFLATDHPIDALVAALMARMHSLRATIGPDPSQAELGRLEGWLYLPSEPLEHLGAAIAGR